MLQVENIIAFDEFFLKHMISQLQSSKYAASDNQQPDTYQKLKELHVLRERYPKILRFHLPEMNVQNLLVQKCSYKSETQICTAFISDAKRIFSQVKKDLGKDFERKICAERIPFSAEYSN